MNDEQMERIEMLGKFIDGQAFRGFMLGDLTKGGQPATRWEAWAFRGKQKNGAPRGLRSCETCGDWRGRCLDPDPRWKGLVMAVACRCANDNTCAWCLRPLAPWKLNSNYYDSGDDSMWHVPTFTGLGHRCAEERRR